jgi:hypothetical protein
MKPVFKSFTITFKNQKDFDTFIEVKKGFHIVDISWTSYIINFEEEEDRQKALDLLTGKVYGIKKENLILGN